MEDIYPAALTDKPDLTLVEAVRADLQVIAQNTPSQKGVFTVILTLATHKILHPTQDIRRHQDNMDGGFSGRSIDTRFITPFLKEKGLTSMSESGWLTRSLEQPYPYDHNYNGKISKLKKEFLNVVDYVQHNPEHCRHIIQYLLHENINYINSNKIEISPLKNPEKIEINKIVLLIDSYISMQFSVAGQSKIPVILIYSLYQCLVKELKRYECAYLSKLGSHTASDRTSKTSGDIEIFIDGGLMESFEIKKDIKIDRHIVNRIEEKIHKFNPKRYYALTTKFDPTTSEDVNTKIQSIRTTHGCQIILGDIIEALSNNLRLLVEPTHFLDLFTQNILSDNELKSEHKSAWHHILKENKLV
jgi:DNA (cytosine-5)-methyltransferase 1